MRPLNILFTAERVFAHMWERLVFMLCQILWSGFLPSFMFGFIVCQDWHESLVMIRSSIVKGSTSNHSIKTNNTWILHRRYLYLLIMDEIEARLLSLVNSARSLMKSVSGSWALIVLSAVLVRLLVLRIRSIKRAFLVKLGEMSLAAVTPCQCSVYCLRIFWDVFLRTFTAVEVLDWLFVYHIWVLNLLQFIILHFKLWFVLF